MQLDKYFLFHALFVSEYDNLCSAKRIRFYASKEKLKVKYYMSVLLVYSIT